MTLVVQLPSTLEQSGQAVWTVRYASLPMAAEVKKKQTRVPGTTRISSKHQVTIPREAFAAAGLAEGDVLRVESAGAGRVVLAREETRLEIFDRLSGSLNTGGKLRADVEALRDEWD